MTRSGDKIPPTIHESKIEILNLFRNGNQYNMKEISELIKKTYPTTYEHIHALGKDGYLVLLENKKWKISTAGRLLIKAVEEGKAIVEKSDDS